MCESFKIYRRRNNNGREFQNIYKNNGREFQNTYKKKEQCARILKHIEEETTMDESFKTYIRTMGESFKTHIRTMNESFKTHIRRKNNGWEFHNI